MDTTVCKPAAQNTLCNPTAVSQQHTAFTLKICNFLQPQTSPSGRSSAFRCRMHKHAHGTSQCVHSTPIKTFAATSLSMLCQVLVPSHPFLPMPLAHPYTQQNFSDVFPHLVTASNAGALVKIADVDFSKIDAVFCCLPHATTQQIIKGLPTDLKIVDLSADFRLRDVNTYAEWCA